MTTANIFGFSDTWNDSGVTFNAIKVDVTDSASASDSTLIDLHVGSASQFSVDKGGIITANGFLADGNVDLQANRLVLDADNDTYIVASTDDRLQIFVGGSEVIRLDANAADTFSLDGVGFSPTGAVIGQALGYPNSTTTLEPYTPAGGGDTLKAADEVITGDWALAGTPLYTDLQNYSGWAVLTDGARFTVAGRTAVDDGGGGLFRWRAGSQFSRLQSISDQVESIDTAADTLTLTTHLFRTGDVCVPNATANGITGNTRYYVGELTADTIALYTTWADAKADTNRVDITGTLGSLFLRRMTDPAQGLNVTLTGDPLGANGCFERVIDGAPNVRMFGAVGDDSTNDAEAIQHADVAAEAFGGELYFLGRIYRTEHTIEKSDKTAWRGPGPNRASSGRGAMITSAFNGDAIVVRGDGVNRRGSISGIRILNHDRALYTSGKGIYFTEDARDQFVTDCYIGNYDECVVCDDGKAIYIERGYCFGAITNGIRLQDVTDSWIIETQADGDLRGIYLLRALACQVISSRPQGSDGTNLRVEDSSFFVMDGGLCDSAVLATSGTPGPALEIVDCSSWRINGVTFYANHANQSQVFIDATSGELNTDGIIEGCSVSPGSSSNIIGIEFGSCAGIVRGITIDDNALRPCAEGLKFNTVTGTLDTITIGGENIFPSSNAITGASNVASGLYVKEGPGRLSLTTHNSPSADIVLNGASPENHQIVGSVSSSINFDLPAAGNYAGKRYRVRRSAMGAGIVTVRHSGATAVATLGKQGDWVEVVATGTTGEYAVISRSFFGGQLTSSIDFNDSDAQEVRTLSFNDTGESVTVSSNAISVSSSTVTLNEASDQTINTITTDHSASGQPWFRVRQVGAGAVTFQHSSSLRLPYGRDIVLNTNEGLLFEVVASDVVQLISKTATDQRDLSEFSGSVVVDNSGADTLFDAGTNGALWRVYVMHTGGGAGASALAVGDSTTPQVEDQISTLGDAGVTTTIGVSGTNITVTSDSATSRTSNWYAYRVV